MRTNGVTAGARLPLVAICAAVEHVLQAVAQGADVVGAVLHLEDDAVIGRRADRLRGAGLGGEKVTKAGFPCSRARIRR